MPHVLANLTVVDFANETNGVAVGRVDNDGIGASRTVDNVLHGVESVLQEEAFPALERGPVEHLGHDVDGHVLVAFGVRALEQLNGALAHMHLAHLAHARLAVVVFALVETHELAALLLVEADHAALHRATEFFRLFDVVVSSILIRDILR